MVIYPVLQKEKNSEIYSWLSNTFKVILKESNILLVIGYSFRDEDITSTIFEAMQSNPELWVIILSPRALAKYDYFQGLSEDNRSRIITINDDIQEALKNSNLLRDVQELEENIIRENLLIC